MAKRGGLLTQSFRQMPNPPLNIVALVVVASFYEERWGGRRHSANRLALAGT